MVNTKPYNILIVEDNEINLLYFGLIIKKLCPDAIIFKAVTGEQAIEIVRQNKLDIIFLDLFLPVLDGFAVAEYIRQDLKMLELPIIALTALNSQEDITHAFKSGMTDFIQKPASQEIINNSLKKYLFGE